MVAAIIRLMKFWDRLIFNNLYSFIIAIIPPIKWINQNKMD